MNLTSFFEQIFTEVMAKRDPVPKWEICAKEKDERRQQTPADPRKKAHRKMVQASRRGNR